MHNDGRVFDAEQTTGRESMHRVFQDRNNSPLRLFRSLQTLRPIRSVMVGTSARLQLQREERY